MDIPPTLIMREGRGISWSITHTIGGSTGPRIPTEVGTLSPSHIEPGMVVGFGLTMGKLVLTGHIDEVVDTIEANIRDI